MLFQLPRQKSSLDFFYWWYSKAWLFRLQLSSGCLVAMACPDGSPLSAQTPWRHVSHRPQASAENPSPYQNNPKEWKRVAPLPGGLASVYASPPAWCSATLLEHELEPKRSEGPEPWSRSSERFHSTVEKKTKKKHKLCCDHLKVPFTLTISWYFTCRGHSVTFMSPLMPLALNVDSWDPVVKDKRTFLSCTKQQPHWEP